MPQNMQKKAKVASLELDENLEEEAVYIQRMGVEEIAQIPEDDDRYQATLKLLKYGNSLPKIVSKLIKEGVMEHRIEAMRLAQRVAEENPQEQRKNATILLSAAGILTLAGLIFISVGYINTGVFPVLAPSYLLIIIGAWFAYKGYQAWNN